MAISQPRMLALLSAAENYREALEHLEHLAQQAKRQRSGTQSTELVLEELIYQITSHGLITRATLETIAQEKAHFRPSTIKRNDRTALKRAIKRAGISDPYTIDALRMQHGIQPLLIDQHRDDQDQNNNKSVQRDHARVHSAALRKMSRMASALSVTAGHSHAHFPPRASSKNLS